MVELTCQHDPGDDERNDLLIRLADLADVGVVADRQRALRRACAGPPGSGAGRDPGPAEPGRHGRLAGRGRPGLPALGSGDGRAAATLPGRAGADRGAGPGVRVRLPGDRPGPARLPRPGRPHRGVLAARAGGAKGPGALRSARRRARAGRVRADRQGTRRDRAAGLPRLLPDRARASSSSASARTSCARAAGRRPTRRSATRSASPTSTRSRTTCCSSGSCPKAGTGRRTSTWTSSTAAGRRSSSTSTTPTAGTGPRRSPT